MIDARDGLAAAFAVMLAAPSGAMAAESGAAGLVRERVGAYLERLSDEIVGDGLDYRLEVADEPDGRIVAAVRDLSWGARRGRWEAGDVVLDLAPLDEGRYAASLALPSAIVKRDRRGRTITVLSAGERDVSGVYDLERGLWTVFDGAMSSVVLWDEESRLEMDGASVSARLDEAAGGWSASAAMDLTGVAWSSLSGARAGSELRLGKAGARFAFGGSGSLPARGGEAHAVAPLPFGDALGLPGEGALPLDNMSLSLALGGVSWSVAESRGAVDGMAFDFAGEGLDGAGGSLRLAWNHDGLDAGVGGAFADLVPLALEAVLVFDGLPALDAVRAAPADVRRLLAEAGSALTIERLVYESAAVRGAATGEVTASLESPDMARGRVRITLGGLRGLVRRMGARAGAGDPDALKALAVAGVLWGLGEEVREDGETRHAYLLELTPDGALTLNGIPLETLREAMEGVGGR